VDPRRAGRRRGPHELSGGAAGEGGQEQVGVSGLEQPRLNGAAEEEGPASGESSLPALGPQLVELGLGHEPTLDEHLADPVIERVGTGFALHTYPQRPA
jgi:hypothetical protein